MLILCGTDFSEPARVAARTAAHLAAKLGAEVVLAHVAQLPGPRASGAEPDPESGQFELKRRRDLLHLQARELRKMGAKVSEELVEGVPDEELMRLSHERQAELIVIAPIGDRRPTLWSLGGVAMRVVKGAEVPTLVVREEASIHAWTEGARELRILFGVDASTSLSNASAWIERFSKCAPVEIVAGHVYARGESREMPREDYERELASNLQRRVGAVAGKTPRLRVLAGWGRVAEHMLELAALEAADLIVVGTHRRAGVDRLVHGSVSLDLIGASARNVLTVPVVPAQSAGGGPPREYKRVLAPVDLSDYSQRAIDYAASLLPRGGVLQLLHVASPQAPAALDYGAFVAIPPPTPEENARLQSEIERRLRSFEPTRAMDGKLELHVEVVTAFNPVEQICAAAERLASDAICICTHGRSGLSKLVLGSVAEGVIRHATVPVLVIPPHAH